jgi:subtilisin family serine protease
VVKFKSSGSAALTDCVKATLARGRSFSAATADGSRSLDKVMKSVKGARSLIPGREGLTTVAAKSRLQTNLTFSQRQRAARAIIAKTPRLDEAVNVYLLDVAPDADVEKVAAELRNDPHVEYAQPNYKVEANYTPNDPFLASSGSWGQAEADLWGLDSLSAEAAWDSARGAGVVVAVVDSGVDVTHPDLAGNVWQNPGEVAGNGVDDDGNGYIDDVVGWDFSEDDSNPNDEHGHGTHVSGTIAAEDDNGQGIVGVAPDARIMAIRGLDRFGSGSTFDLAQGIIYAAANGADVINNSWGCNGNCPSNPVAEEAVRFAHDAGSVVVFAAGNSNLDIGGISPQNQPEVLVVSSSTPTDARSSFSNFGLVDVAAPGSGDASGSGDQPVRGILSLKSAICEPSLCSPGLIVGGQYLRQAGTSMAAPHVAGLAALVRSQHPEYSPEQIRQAIRRSGSDSNGGGYDPDLGYGRAFAEGALGQPTPLSALITAPLVAGEAVLPIMGTAAGAGFQSYLLEYGFGKSPSSWTAIATSATPVTGDDLAVWNLSNVADGNYTLRLTALTADGRSYEDRHEILLDHLRVATPEPRSAHKSGSVLSVTGTAAPGNFGGYTIYVERLADDSRVTEAQITVTGGGQQPIVDGELGTWNTAGIPAGHYRIVVEVTHLDGSTSREPAVVLVDPLLKAGWPRESFNNTFPGLSFMEHVTLADVNGDGKAEQVIAWDDRVSVFTQDGEQLPGWPQTIDPDGIYALTQRSPAVGDIDGDGKVEIVATNMSNQVIVWNPDGTLKAGWPRTMPGDLASVSIALADVDGDGKLDIVVTHYISGIHVLRYDGSSPAGFPAPLGWGAADPAVVADLDLDGDAEIVVSVPYAGNLVVLDHHGAVVPGWPQNLSGSFFDGSYPIVGDLDADGDLEIVAVSPNTIYAFQHTGAPVAGWPVSPGVSRLGAPVLGDLDRNGSLEVAVGAAIDDPAQQKLYVFNSNGALRSGWPYVSPTTTNGTFWTPIFADVTGDGKAEVIAAQSPDRFAFEVLALYGFTVQAFKDNGTRLPEFARPAFGGGGTEDVSPGIGDLDGDGLLELAWTEVSFDYMNGRNRVRSFVWDLTAPASNYKPWPMFRRDPLHSAIAPSVLPVLQLKQSDMGKSFLVNRVKDFALRTGGQGVLQFIHPWNAAVKVSINGGPLRSTPQGWGGPFSVPPNTNITFRVVTPSAMNVNVQWW